jgi:cold shock CspA family protein
MYQRYTARSDEQALNVHMRQPILEIGDKHSLIEEENKSGSQLNLSTSSRSYRPGFNKSKSTVYSNDGSVLSTPQTNVYPQTYHQSMIQGKNQQYFFANPMTQMPPVNSGTMINYSNNPMTDQMGNPYAGHYNYPMGMMVQPPMMHSGQPSPFAQKSPSIKQSNSVHCQNNLSNYGSDKLIEGNTEENKNRNSLNAPTIQAVTTASSSNLTSGSTSPPTGELRLGTGFLKFFNQQHQYGFIVSEKDGSDIFFHYDDVKHTLLSKEFLRHATENYEVKFSFQILDYIGKYEFSKKAVNINLLSIIDRNTDN